MALNILVVDDSAVMRSVIVKTLRMCGLPIGEVHEAANGQEGLAAVDQHWIDLVLVDINMPVMNGEEMVRHLRARPDARELPIIVVSTEGSQTRIERLQHQGAHFIHKPFSPEVVREVVQQVTGVTHEAQA